MEKTLTPVVVILLAIAFWFDRGFNFDMAVLFLYMTSVAIFFTTFGFLMNNKLYSKDECTAKLALPTLACMFAMALTGYFILQITFYQGSVKVFNTFSYDS